MLLKARSEDHVSQLRVCKDLNHSHDVIHTNLVHFYGCDLFLD